MTLHEPGGAAGRSQLNAAGRPAAVSVDPNARPARVEVVARGTTFVAERSYAKGSVSPDPSTYMSNDEIVAKFLHNAEGVLRTEDAEWVADRTMHLEDVDDFSTVLDRLRPSDD